MRWIFRGGQARRAGVLALICAGVFFAAGCVSLDEATPEQAIARAAAREGGQETTVRLVVRNAAEGVGGDEGGFYLNSFEDYRDERSLNLIVTPKAARELAAAGMGDFRAAFLGREVLARGVVRRVRVGYFEGGVPTGRFYHQTQMRIHAGAQIVLVESGRRPSPPPVIDVRSAREADFIAADPANPARALYVHDLQKRIDEGFSRQQWLAWQSGGVRVPSGRSVRMTLTVLPGGQIAADEAELSRCVKREPELSALVLSTLLEINKHPVPFSEAMIASGVSGITYEGVFNIR